MRKYTRDDVQYDTWYGKWARDLALRHTRPELEVLLAKATGEGKRASAQHHRAIQRTSSMTSQSQARAQSGNVSAGAYETASALRAAIEIHELFPEYAKT